ncbi:MAG TPA: alpha/beta hydrolase domain-containing protein [Candidatus Saccharimonadales bacterium]|nr:alpha/beta hydrolase domain-containing protein [Candidatus Saccharimonadales bacterium]
MKNIYRGMVLAVLVLWAGTAGWARVTRVEILSRADALGGQAFGPVGAYERITGKVYFSVRVDNAHNQGIVDLGNAVNLRDGEVEFSADFVAVRPKDAAKGNGTLLLENPNRGHSRILSLVDGGDEDLAHSAGDGWLLRNGFTVVALGWQWDAVGADALRLYAPIARENGKTITGLLRGDFMLAAKADEVPLGHLMPGSIGGSEYAVADATDARNTLTVRDTREGKRTTISRSEWQFAATVNGETTPSDRSIHLKGGFAPGRIYEYVYAVKDPVVAGLGFAAVRDFAAYAKHASDAVTPAARVLGEGISQNGRFLRDLLYEGFNADEDGRMALDGVLSHVAGAGRGSFNCRFAQPSRDAQPSSAVFFPTDIFPFTDQPEVDPATGEKGGLLDRASRDNVVPKIFFSHTSYEYWGRAASLIHTSADGKTDAVIGPRVRIYHFTGLQHFSGPWPPKVGEGPLHGQEPQTPLAIKYFWRAMIANMDAWVRNGTPPPASVYSTIAAQTLVPLRAWKFPKIPGVNVPTEANAAYELDYGAQWHQGILSVVPPKVGKAFTVLVPQVNADGNETGGIHLPEITVPLATFTGWNLRDASIGAPTQRVSFLGSYLPFPEGEPERAKSGDPRKSIRERYKGREDYLEKFAKAADALIQERWILPEDRGLLLERGAAEWDYLVH